MEAGTRDSSQPPTTAEEEVLKRNTDCVYFLASPLTCKKGSECEYRHSEYARVNPRDCWFWLNGNCLNPKCSFRHPPLDGLVGSPVAGSYLPPSQTGVSTQIPTAHTPAPNSGKPAIPCVYFQKGNCLKGDRCPFLHGPQPIVHPMPQLPMPKVATSVTETQTLKKAFGGLEKCTQQQKFPKVNIKPFEIPPAAKPASKAESVPPKTVVAVNKSIHAPIVLDDEIPRYRPTNVPAVISGNSISRSQRNHQSQLLDNRSYQNGKDADEYLGESSPGFDVLVEDELRDSDYYHNEDEFGRTRGHEGGHLNVKEFDYSSADYSSLAQVDRGLLNDSHSYDSHRRLQDQYAWEPRMASSQRILQGPSVPERRGFHRPESPDQINESDLRHRLLKQRRVNGLRSAISPDRHGDFYRRDRRDHHVEEQRYRGRSQRDSRQLPHESSLSSRLQGRIMLPGRSSPDNHNSEREMDKGRNWGRLSPARLPISSHQGRPQDPIKRRAQEDFNIEGRNSRGPRIRGEEHDNNTSKFARPKSLAELKGSRVSESSEQQQVKGQQLFHLGKQTSTNRGKLVGNEESESSLLFEGPKPLSLILKRKRNAEMAVSGSGMGTNDGEESNQRERVENLIGSSKTTKITEMQTVLPFESEKEANQHAFNNEEEPRSRMTDMLGTEEEDEEGQISTEWDNLAYEGQYSHIEHGSELEIEEGMMIDDAMEGQEIETFDQRDGESDNEHVDGEDENADLEEEDLDDEDGDDFAKRIGVMFS
ncbi:hypothetical protein HHK36_014641 [Tetracentron sinense]|uniref:C3H1-type domain-containing protein n=1 Tax=Tetracentron sinense TaxID=13715 RepID=A0A834Z5X6_TETSI|nr:hypothetical protein HHK36_014641 [Tetracentron sinense]